jgi:hypothetical protein
MLDAGGWDYELQLTQKYDDSVVGRLLQRCV